ncbi:lysylphosphatidylglycerol synthase transmembrane domain-containing protein [Rubrivirga sp. S365]|uniref:Lysylphosphatidylglycerol synthase transmembrane domain-containing protein n=1 Tax=Rubrivirga litoralis TaxID=3075598 RepID=A0ABU3BVC7_9BACT|nr:MULTISPECIES: lysylphosphatidylglycerol synthase transmembrane domain-containing protein [unclassified Rubrivirga]MDT0633242.1 lysylphosphatidylglycerol synthase transmembrane domain-containing protein [Rubrivirga sp. F394]MDT7857808.1 lysylphosphatidylglycerol synthase transmembrane domain-containing protein [Rubrivirga sp. S365]
MRGTSPADRFGTIARAAAVLVPLGVVGNVALTLLTTERAVLDAVAGLPLAPLALAGALAVVPWTANALRLQLWTSFVGYPLRFRTALRVVLGGLLGSAVTPTGSGGATLKWALLARHGVPAGRVGSLLVVETVENAAFMAVAVPAAVVVTAAADVPVLRDTLSRAGAGLAPLLAVAVAALVALGLAAWGAARGALGRTPRRLAARWRGRLRRPFVDAQLVARLVARRGKGRLALGVALAAAQWTAKYSVAAAVLAFLGVPVDPVLSWLLQWTAFTAMNAVPTPGAAGGAEAVFAALYSPFVPISVLGLATAAWRLTLFYAPLVVAAVAFLGLSRGARPRGPGALSTTAGRLDVPSPNPAVGPTPPAARPDGPRPIE